MRYLGLEQDINIDQNMTSTETHQYVGSLKSPTSRNRRYVFKCLACANDEELFGNSLFYTNKADFLRGQAFCGCGKVVLWTQEQAIVKSKRAAVVSDVIFNHLVSPYSGTASKCSLSCKSCDHSWLTPLGTLWGRGSGCSKCRNIKASRISRELHRKSEHKWIAAFMESGFYGDEKVFTKINRVDKYNRSIYWNIACLDCRENTEAQQGSILRGVVRCSCVKEGQKEAYINIVYDNDLPIALKFGISKDSLVRLQQHNYISNYKHTIFAIYQFDTPLECRSAERLCKNSIPRGVIDKEMMPAGWTETCYTKYLEDIMEIFSSMGGKRIL